MDESEAEDLQAEVILSLERLEKAERIRELLALNVLLSQICQSVWTDKRREDG